MCAGNRLLVKAGGLVRRSSRRSMGGPRARRGVPHERRSDARGSGLWAGGAIGREVLTVFFASLTPQGVAFEFDAVGLVNDAVQYRIAEGGITEHVRVPLFSSGSCVTSRSLTRIIFFLGTGLRC